MISSLDRKLLRDLWRLRGQVVSIAFVIASGIGVLVMSLSLVEALSDSASTYYERYRFAHVFASVKRAPLHLEPRIAALEGVQSVQLRIVQQAVLDVEGFPEPVMGRLVSIPEGEQPVLDQLVLRRGRLVEPGRPDEVVINESFAQAHGLAPGDTLSAIVDDAKRELQIVGTAMSPEFVFVLSPGALIPDKKRYGILWMGRSALEAAYGYEGAFNDLALTVQRGTDTRKIIQILDAWLDPYGTTGAIDRADHPSNWFVMNEIEQNRATARILPTIFLVVAGFLINMVLSRLVATERSEIGLLKAFGYSDLQVGLHYAKLVVAMTFLGILLGWGIGAALGRIVTGLYTESFNLPVLVYRPGPSAFVIGAGVSLAIALVATARSVRGAARLPPVVAMRPPAPPLFHRHADRPDWVRRLVDEPTRILFRQIGRWPLRAAVTALGFAGATALMVLSFSFGDAVEVLARAHFAETQREELALGFREPKSATVLHEIERLPGILSAEPMRVVAADLSSGHRKHRGAIQGLERDALLTRVFDTEHGPVDLPEQGLVLARVLADKLGVEVGDDVHVHVLTERRPEVDVPVAAIHESYIGMAASMEIGALGRLLGDRTVVEYVNTILDESRTDELMARLKETPTIATVAWKSVALENFHATVAKSITIFIGFFSMFAFALGFGVTYNAQRIALSERSRELATLRVLGFTRGDALYILLGETLLLAFLALPFGCLLGIGLTVLFVTASEFQTELMRLPLAIEPASYGLAMLFLLFAGAVSGLAMKRRVDRLDLIGVLKTRE